MGYNVRAGKTDDVNSFRQGMGVAGNSNIYEDVLSELKSGLADIKKGFEFKIKAMEHKAKAVNAEIMTTFRILISLLTMGQVADLKKVSDCNIENGYLKSCVAIAE